MIVIRNRRSDTQFNLIVYDLSFRNHLGPDVLVGAGERQLAEKRCSTKQMRTSVFTYASLVFALCEFTALNDSVLMENIRRRWLVRFRRVVSATVTDLEIRAGRYPVDRDFYSPEFRVCHLLRRIISQQVLRAKFVADFLKGLIKLRG